MKKASKVLNTRQSGVGGKAAREIPVEYRGKVLRDSVRRDAKTGCVLVNGINARQLVNKFPALKILAAPGQPKFLSRIEIAEIVRAMKIS